MSGIAKCPKCGQENPNENRFCRKCGAMIDTSPVSLQARSEESSKTFSDLPEREVKKKCMKCHTPLNEYYVCPQCYPPPAARANDPEFVAWWYQQKRAEMEGRDNRTAVFGCLTILAIVALGIWGYRSLLSGSNMPSASHQVEITREEFGDKWPFTVEGGTLSCRGSNEVYFTVNGVTYAVNGAARNSKRYAEIDEI